MKNVKRRLVSFLLVSLTVLSLFLFSSCIPVDSGKATVEEFYTALGNDDFEKAATFIHPVKNTDTEELRRSIATLEDMHDIDFSDGIEFLQTLGVNTSSFLNIPKGVTKTLNLTYLISISKKEFTLYVEIVEDPDGYGITSFTLESEDSSVV